MKYIAEYIEKKLKLKVLGKLKLREYQDISDGGIVGVELIIDNYAPGIQIWYVDYVRWLEEEKIPEICQYYLNKYDS